MCSDYLVVTFLLFFFTANAGVSSFRPNGRIIAGDEVNPPHSVPFAVAILHEMADGSYFHGCGASLISNDFVLTAAHCVQDGFYITPAVTIALGVHNRTIKEPTQLRFKVGRSNFTVHPDYPYCWTKCDIALIRLPQTIIPNKYIKPVQLPSFRNVTSIFKNATTYGWGCTKADQSNTSFFCSDKYHSQVLRYANLTLIMTSNTTNFGSSVDNDRQGICKFDSGGPVVSEGVQIGINDYVTELHCQSGQDGFVSVLYYLNWIQNVTGIDIKP